METIVSEKKFATEARKLFGYISLNPNLEDWRRLEEMLNTNHLELADIGVTDDQFGRVDRDVIIFQIRKLLPYPGATSTIDAAKAVKLIEGHGISLSEALISNKEYLVLCERS